MHFHLKTAAPLPGDWPQQEWWGYNEQDSTKLTTIWRTLVNILHKQHCLFFYHGATIPNGPRLPHCRGFTITLRHITLGRTPLDEWSARRRDIYLTTHNSHNRLTSMPPALFEPAIQKSELPQTNALDRAATGTSNAVYEDPKYYVFPISFLLLL